MRRTSVPALVVAGAVLHVRVGVGVVVVLTGAAGPIRKGAGTVGDEAATDT